MAHDLVESDNVDVTLSIGTDFEGTPPQTVNDNEWEIIEAEVVLTTHSTPDYVDMVITPSDGTAFPERPSVPFVADPNEPGDGSPEGFLGRTMTLDVDTELRADIPDEFLTVDTSAEIAPVSIPLFEGEVTRIFTGRIANMTPVGDYTYEAIAYDPTQQQFNTQGEDDTSFMNQTINLASSTERTVRNIAVGLYGGADRFEPGDNRIPIKELINIVMDEAGVPEEKRFIELSEDQNEEITFSTWDVTVREILDRATSSANAEWFFDRYGNFYFKTPEANEDIFAYKLKYITSTSDGKQSPPWRGVRVIGDGVSSKEGWSKSALINEQPVTATGSTERIQEEQAELAEPVFTYRNMEINTKQEAINVKSDIVDQLKKQRGSGTVTVVGFPEVRPYDAIQMPNTNRQPMGGERYGVEKVTHRLNPTDGFVTKIDVSGLVGYQETLLDEDVAKLEQELQSQWRLQNRIDLIERGITVGL